jgi:outer membrane protein OmpA-like peptidoglycan-associated protein
VYNDNPAAGVFSVAAGTNSYDVSISSGSQFTSVSFELCDAGSSGEIDWFDSLNGQSYPVQPAPVAVSGSPGCYTVNLNATSVPTSNDQTLYGSIFFVPAPQGQPSTVSNPKPREVIVTLDPFVTGSSVLLTKMKNQLLNLATMIKRLKGKSLTITGYTDSRDGASYNLTLGLQRALSADKFLVAQLKRLGVKINFSIRVISKGLASPAASNTTTSGEAKNRRVVLVAWLY